MPAYHVFDQDGQLIESGTLPEPPPAVTVEDRLAAVEDAVDTLILDSLGGPDV